jgi:hypothetical protein
LVNWKCKCLAIFLFIFVACSQQFDSKKWKEADDPADKTRYSMAEDLVESKILIGKRRSEVKMLLGDSPNTMENDSLNWYYRVWDYYGSDIDPIKSYGLHVQFNKNGQATLAEIQKWK